jgi:hypothetical protein
MIEKLLLKRCSTEVQLMLTRMKERPEDFDYGTGWRKLVEMASDDTAAYTKVERMMIRAHWKACRDVRSRRELLGNIMQQTINPTTREDIEDGGMSRRALQNHLQQHYAKVQAGALNTLAQYNDPRALYGQYGQNTGAQGRVV